jgi:thiamine-phosphate pyrophosphorylase
VSGPDHAIDAAPREPLRLILLDAAGDDAGLDDLLAGGLVAAVVAQRRDARLVELCRAAGVALLAGEGSDGALVAKAAEVGPVRRRMGAEAIIGAAVGLSRHAAMTAGENGADWVLFGEPGRPVARAVEMAAWWAPLFVLPCAVTGPISAAEVPEIAAAGADFVALPKPVWTAADALAGVVDAVRALP